MKLKDGRVWIQLLSSCNVTRVIKRKESLQLKRFRRLMLVQEYHHGFWNFRNGFCFYWQSFQGDQYQLASNHDLGERVKLGYKGFRAKNPYGI